MQSLLAKLVDFLPYIQIGLAALLAAGVLLQRNEASLGGAFGGSDNWSASFHTRRGFEKTLFYATVVIAVLFTLASLIAVAIN